MSFPDCICMHTRSLPAWLQLWLDADIIVYMLHKTDSSVILSCDEILFIGDSGCILITLLQYYLVCQKKILYVPMHSMSKIPGCPTTSHSHFSECKAACLSGYSVQQSSAQHEYVQEGWRKAQCYDKGVCPNFIHTAAASTQFEWAAAVCTKRKYAIWPELWRHSSVEKSKGTVTWHRRQKGWYW